MKNDDRTQAQTNTQEVGHSLDDRLERGMSDIRAGRIKPAEEVFDRLEAKYTRMLQTLS